MKEELFISGRNIPNIDPYLHLWHWPIAVYLFLGGLAAGILFFAALYTILGREKEFPTVIKYAPFVAPVAIILGLIALLFDLTNILYSWRLYTTIRLESPMSWGAWTLMAITPVSFIWAANNIKEIFPKWDWKFKVIKDFFVWFNENKILFAWITIVLAILLGTYTGILLSAFNARPLWNTSILGPLFLVSGLSSGAAAIMLLSKSHHEKKFFSKVDLILIVIELFFIIHLVMSMQAGSQVQTEAAALFLGGQYTVTLWVFVVFIGMIFPGLLEILELRGFKVPVALPAICILLGGLVLRFLMINAGQFTRYLY